MGKKVTAAITAENQWTDAIQPKHIKSAAGNKEGRLQDFGTLNLSISGTWAGEVSLQIAYDGGSEWINTGEKWTINTTKIITCYEPGVSFRIGIATGDYVSGTCNVRLSR